MNDGTFGMLGAKYEAAGFEIFRDSREGDQTGRQVIRVTCTRYTNNTRVLRLSVRAAEALKYPEHVQVSFDRGGRRMMIRACSIDAAGSIRVSRHSGATDKNRALCNKEIVNTVCVIAGEDLLQKGQKLCFKGEPAKSVPGALIFDLSKPERKTTNDR
jgi:hypothetical protein